MLRGQRTDSGATVQRPALYVASGAVGKHTEGKSLSELLDMIERGYAEPGSSVGQAILATIQVRIAELQRDTAREAATWARWSALATGGAALIALVALLIAVL